MQRVIVKTVKSLMNIGGKVITVAVCVNLPLYSTGLTTDSRTEIYFKK